MRTVGEMSLAEAGTCKDGSCGGGAGQGSSCGDVEGWTGELPCTSQKHTAGKAIKGDIVLGRVPKAGKSI